MTKNKESTRYYSSIQEKKVAKDLKGKCSANSGAALWSEGDVRLKNTLIECKTCITDKNSFSIKKEWLTKLKEEALFAGKDYHSLVFNYGPKQDNYFIIPQWMFEEYLELLKGDKINGNSKN